MISILQLLVALAPLLAVDHPKNDYGKPENWLCRPGRAGDVCAVSSLDSTTVMADGQLEVVTWKRNPNPPVDCFYVYPTVSNDATANSDMAPSVEERRMTEHQFARFASQCRVYAPLYRQVTLSALRTLMAGKPIPDADFALPYKDVSDAWNHYLEHDNQGRGVVLIGHSQGALVLTQLISEQLDKNPAKRALLISAILLGANLPVPAGKEAGGAFDNIPLCRSTEQTGCAVAFSSFRATDPPPANTLFGKLASGLTAACVNPAALAGGKATLRAYLSANGTILTPEVVPLAWVSPAPKPPIATPFVTVPGLLTGECITDERGSYLAVSVNGDPKDARADDIKGDVVAAGVTLSNWGLHPIDMHLVMGDLLDLVGKQSQSWLADDERTAQSIADAVADAMCQKQVVLLGEPPTHGEARAFDVKSRITDRLIARCGFTGVLFEAPIYDFIGLERAAATRTATQEQMDNAIGRFWWTRELGPWRRALFEAATQHRVVVGGLDDQVSITSQYAKAVLPGLVAAASSESTATECRDTVSRHLGWTYDATNPFDEQERGRLQQCARNAADAAGANRSLDASDRVMLESFARYADRQRPGVTSGRDESMYRNLEWSLDRLPAKSRVVVWTATVHAARTRGSLSEAPLGARAVERWGDVVGAVGFTAYGGYTSRAGRPSSPIADAPPESLEATATTESAWALLDSQKLRTLGRISSRLLGKFVSETWADYFDAVVVIRQEVAPTFDPWK